MRPSNIDDELTSVRVTADDGVVVSGRRWLLRSVGGETEWRDLIESNTTKAAVPLRAALKEEMSF